MCNVLETHLAADYDRVMLSGQPVHLLETDRIDFVVDICGIVWKLS